MNENRDKIYVEQMRRELEEGKFIRLIQTGIFVCPLDVYLCIVEIYLIR